MPDEPKHTPGPWVKLDHREVDQGILITDEAGAVGVCRVVGESQVPRKHSKAICAANANLIAAAPDLLAACEAMHRELRLCADQLATLGYHSKAGGSVHSAIAAGDNAIAKAKAGAA